MKRFSLIIILLQVGLLFGQTKVTAPSGTTYTKSSSDSRAHALTSAGQTITISNSAWNQYGTCYYWGLDNIVTEVINAANTTPPGTNCSGMSDVTYSAGLSNLAAGVLVYTGTTRYKLMSGSSFIFTTVPTRVTYRVTDTFGAPISLSTFGTLKYLRVISDFRVNILIEARHPSSSTYYPAINLYNILGTDPNFSICTSNNVDQFYKIDASANTTNLGPYCVTDSIRLTGTGSSSSFQWTGPSSFSSYSSDTTFINSGFPNGSAFTLTVTDTMGCQDTSETIVTVRDTAAKIELFGNANSISNGSVTTSSANATDFGFVSVGGNIAKTFTIKNNGTGTLNVNQVFMASGGTNDFSISGISPPNTILAGDSQTFIVTFTPTSTGVKRDTIKILNNNCSNHNFTFLIEGGTGSCDSSNPIALSAGLHVGAISQTTSGWTCYCDSTGDLLLALKLGGTGAVVPTSGVSLNIGSPMAEHHPKNTGFIKADLGFSVWNRTWDVQPTVQPSSQVPVRYFFSGALVDSIDQSLVDNALAPLPSTDSIYFWKVTNSGLGTHPAVSSITIADMKLIEGGASFATDSTWVRGTNPSNQYAEFLVSGFSGGGAGGGSLGGTPLVELFTGLSAERYGGLVKLNWKFNESQFAANYTIYRKEAGGTFERIGSVAGKNKPFTLCEYEFIYNDAKEGKSYYYQIQVELFNGKTAKSNIAYLNYGLKYKPVLAYPNPLDQWLTVRTDGDGEEEFTIEIINITGQRLISLKTTHSLNEIDVSNLAGGIYTLRASNKSRGQVYVLSMIKR